MGCDGGSICDSRPLLVKLKAKPKQIEKDQKQEIYFVQWTTCAISSAPLREPIVTCRLGYLYNKETVLECLVTKKFPAEFSHIRTLKDVVEIKFAANADYRESADSEAANAKEREVRISRFICPITLVEANGQHGFCVIWTCGHAFSEKAMKEVPTTTCHECGKPFTSADVIELNATGEALDRQRKRLEDRKASEKAQQKEKKAAKSEGMAADGNGADTSNGKDVAAKSTKRKADGTSPPSKSAKIAMEIPLAEVSVAKPISVAKAAEAVTLQKKQVSSAYASLFTSSVKDKVRETFLCRNVSLGRR
mmetsp:Transcript_12891/g.21068  ORF Transcript_12891/g.21068 Transcript_12891/m.21068 type:complete len:307 (+) Transcript_12891:61-981(+)|eukprot:CAMPEP_0184343930 /NCGR_PEP_ID=MMETSP1089-20130417/12438_1 /TAXON_ID=38269 ORGANISM="Gloeochaete wittrockiana, Strain SAG46.84" /NCGR_SAMPLE_ID=MMETSP1089 /ASSEMBLY_ACC=CAM_ASM_000445 /LENGTH=306 /DNA_ID=CAMNT_0026673485 /DNA_START=49 /DNA_END=969 /DNA_ORIENTATION=-